MAGSHVIVKTPDGEIPDRTFEEAGRLAAYYSKGRTAPKVEIDYIQKKHVKKPGGAKPGFVVYYTNYSLMAAPDITGIKEAPSLNWRAFLMCIYNFYFATKLTILFGT